MNQNTNHFKQTNAYAMQYGLFLGLWGIATLVTGALAMKLPSLSFLNTVLFIGSPILAGYFTTCFRRAVMQPEFGFTFGRGFVYTFMMGMYACLWIALFVFVYMQWFDNGTVINLYTQQLNQPEVREALAQNPDIKVEDIIKAIGAIKPITIAISFIYITLFTAPFISTIIALICRRRPQFFPKA